MPATYKRVGVAGVAQVFVTVITFLSAITALVFAFFFEDFQDKMVVNLLGDIQTSHLPCVRNPLPRCSGTSMDRCQDFCCPPQYYCKRSPIVGLHCEDGDLNNKCGNHNWCRDFADIPGLCATKVCKDKERIRRVTVVSYILAALAALLDVVDFAVLITLPDALVLKSSVNLFSAILKMIAFCVVLGAGTNTFLSDQYDAKCYNAEGMNMNSDASLMFMFYCTMQIVSASLSLVLAPVSAYFGGKLACPYNK